ncbi:phage tail tape measure protein [Rhodococcoides corynebacterioides]|uniref:phage tail tape measure protein n=1 Tax=Rhodococcoides corynebacterioides TaxID=53972 RepID=UPI003F8061BE
MTSIGWATLSIIPEVSGFSNNVSSQIGAPLRAAGERAGRDAGQAISGGIAAAQAQVDKATTALAKSQDKVADAAGRTRVAEAQLQSLRERGVTDAAKLTAAQERLEAAKRKEAAASGEAERASRALTTAQERAATATDDIVVSSERASGGLRSMFSGIDGGVKGFAALAAGAGAASGAMAAVGSAIDKEMGADKLAASLGASGALAAEYGEAAAKAYASGAGSSLAEVQSVTGQVAMSFRDLGFEGEVSMDKAAQNALQFADIFDTDVSASIETASQLVKNGLAANSTEAFDLMTQSFQTVPAAMRDELPEIIQEYGTNFRALGFEGEDAFNLLVSAADQGKFALDKTGDALKEFTIRGSDMSKSSVAAYEAVGLNAEEMSRAIASGGPEAQAALQQTAAALNGMTDPAAKANAAIALFGTPLEDLSVDQIPAFLDGLAGAAPAMAGFEGASERAGATMYDNLGSRLEVMKRGFQDTFVSMVGDNVLPMLGEFTAGLEENEGSALATIAGMTGLGGALTGFETAKGTFDSVKEGVVGFKDGLVSAKETASGALDTMKGAASSVADGWNATKGAAASAASGAKTAALAVGSGTAAFASNTAAAASNAAAHARTAAAAVASRVALVAGTVATAAATGAQWLFNAALSANPIGLIIAAVAGLVAGLVWFFTQTETGQKIVTAAWDAIRAGWDYMWNLVSTGITAFGDALGWIGSKAGEAKDWVVGRFNDLVLFVTGLPGKISSAASGMWDGIKNAFKGAINYIIQAWNAIEFRIPGFEVGPIKWDGFTLGLPDIPMLAGGGVAGRRSNGTLFGPGTGTSDSILGVDAFGMPTALVSTNEGVVKESAMQNGGSELVAALNAGWVPPVDYLRSMLPAFAAGGVVGANELVEFAKGVEGKPYDWGGVNWGDCSGAISAIANFATGRAPFGSRFATMTEGAELSARGFASGLGGAGDLNVGWYNGGPYGGHTAATLPNGVNFEMGGARGDGQYGGQAAGARDSMFTDHAHLALVAAQAVQPNVEQLSPLNMPTDTTSAVGAAAADGGAGSAAATSSTQSFSARERISKMGSDIGGIWADAAVEILGIGEWLDLADRYTIKASDSGGAAAAAGPAPATPGDPKNGVEGDLNMHPLIVQAQDFLKGVGLFDTGGVLEPGSFGFNGLAEPEYVLKDAHWKTAEANINKVDDLVGSGVGGRGPVINQTFHTTVADQAGFQRQTNRNRSLAMMQYGGRPEIGR